MKNYFETKAKQAELRFTFNSYNPFRKNKKIVSFANNDRIKKASETPTDYSPDKLQDFLFADTIKEEEKFCPNGFEFLKNRRLYSNYRIIYDPETHFPSICIDRNLHLQLQ